jgi:UDP-glucuronate 4-epimerase
LILDILVTGSAGFVGSALCLELLKQGYSVLGIDNHNDYYDPQLKADRFDRHLNHPNYQHLKIDLADKEALNTAFVKYQPKQVVNLAAQAGVRYSIDQPLSYLYSNLLGFGHILEACRHHQVSHLLYASSSSVYGANQHIPFSVDDNVDHPLSLYVASKKSNELMAHAYSHLYQLPTTGLRFFTVYGPWGRPDMAPFKFTKSILAGDAFSLYNYGRHKRDFTYIDDVVQGILKVLEKPATPNQSWNGLNPDPASSLAPWRIYNIGNSAPVDLLDFIQAIEDALGVRAKMELLPLQPGDVVDTHADVTDLVRDFDNQPATSIQVGVDNFVQWYRSYYQT